MVAAVALGKVRSFDPARGYGFIAPFSGGEDVFLHVNDVLDDKRDIRHGTVVEFDPETGDRGPKASGVRIRSQSVRSDSYSPGPLYDPPRTRSLDLSEDPLCDVLSAKEFRHEITDVLLRIQPSLTGDQILAIRGQFAKMATSYGWIEN
jgi:cold shock CspA family protein